MPLFGAHMSIAGGLYKAVDAAASFGMETVQIFTGSPQIWAVPPVATVTRSTSSRAKAASAPSKRAKAPNSELGDGAPRGKLLAADDVARFKATLEAKNIRHPIAHDSYLINLASPDDALWRRSIDAFIVELLRAEQLGLAYVVTHPGAATGASEAAGLARVVAAIDEVHRQTPKLEVRTLLETTAGQGSCLGWKFEHLASILDGVQRPERVAVCFDTCHVFAAGYPLADERDYHSTMKQCDATVGLSMIKAFHLNDSKAKLGARVDRHAHLGRGEIGVEAFRHLLNDPRFADSAMYLETPKEREGDLEMDAVNMALIRQLSTSESGSQPARKTRTRSKPA